MIKTTTHNTGITAIRPGVDRLTAANAKNFKDNVIEVIDTGSSRFVVDFSDVAFVDSSGLGALVGLLKKIGHRGELAVCGLNPDVTQMFEICRMDQVFKTYGTVDAAISNMAESL